MDAYAEIKCTISDLESAEKVITLNLNEGSADYGGSLVGTAVLRVGGYCSHIEGDVPDGVATGIRFKLFSLYRPSAQEDKFFFKVSYDSETLSYSGYPSSEGDKWAGRTEHYGVGYNFNGSFMASFIVRLYRTGSYTSPPPLEGSNFNLILQVKAAAQSYTGSSTTCDPFPVNCHTTPGSWGPPDPNSESSGSLITANFVVGSVIGGGNTCTTPAIPPQVMAPVKAHQFNDGVGTTVGGHNFILQFEDCGNLNKKIRYRIKAHGDSPGQGLLPLISPSTAKGVAVLVRRSLHQSFSNFESVHIGQWTEINNDQSSYFIPLQVRYYRTGTVRPGTVHAAMTIETEYQ